MAQRQRRTMLTESNAASRAELDLGDRYVYRDKERVQDYLVSHPHLAEILREADPEIASRFGEGTKVSLAVEDDVDQVGVETLWGVIRTRLTPDDALDLLRRFDREWWIARSATVREELALTIGFGER